MDSFKYGWIQSTNSVIRIWSQFTLTSKSLFSFSDFFSPPYLSPVFNLCHPYSCFQQKQSIYFQVVPIKSWDYVSLAKSESYTQQYALAWGPRMQESSFSKGKSRFSYQKKSYSDAQVKKGHVYYRYLSKKRQ